MPIDDEKDWAPASLKEFPFWREGMTVEEFEEERTYFYKYWDTNGRMSHYTPLWKQREQRGKNKKD